MATAGVASSIFEFLADSTRDSLELPHMTSGQRKSVKKLLQQHPELRCESFGFGEERQMHLFKAGVAKHSSPVSAHPEPAVVGVNEYQLDSSHLTAAALSKIQDGGIASPDYSTAAPSEASDESRKESAFNCCNHREAAHQMLQSMMSVRNTFIHIDEAPVDERAVQSMPRNMFSQCILAETLQRTALNPCPAPTSNVGCELDTSDSCSAQVKQHERRLAPGAFVIVEGLVKLPAFNGRSAVVQGWDESTGRYDIMIAAEASPGGCQQAKIKEENLRLVLSHI